MALKDLIFWTDANNNTGLPNITGEELAAQLQTGQNAGALVTGSAPQSIPDATPTTINQWDTIVYDDAGFFDPLFPDRLTVPVTDPLISRVQLYYEFSWQPNATGFRQQFLEQNGVGGVAGGIALAIPVVGAAAPLSASLYSMPIECEPGDVFTMVAQQNSTLSIVVVLLGFGIKVSR